ncbi:MAG: MCE family protein [Actinomycetes bacterium]
MTRRLLRWPRAVATVAAAALVAGCQGAYDLPLPGGAATGDDAYRVTVEFADVLDLVPQSSVKVDDVTVGAVEEITLDGWTARVRLRLAGDVELPDNAVAELRQTSLLGEKFVSLAAPPLGAVGDLSDGDVIPLDRTTRGAEVEEVLGALSLLLNGGGVAQLQIINRELGDALEGRESDVRGVIEQLDVFVSGLDEQKSEIVRAIEATDRLAATLARQTDDLAVALDEIPAGLAVLADQREQLTAMLTALSELGVTASRVIEASQEDTVANLEALGPVLEQLEASGDALTDSLELLFTYPFADSSLLGIRGDYTNLEVTADLDFQAVCLELGRPGCEPPEGGGPPAPPALPDPTAPLCEIVDGLPVGPGCEDLDADELCELLGAQDCEGAVTDVCDELGTPLPLCPEDGGGSGGGGGEPGLPGVPDLPGIGSGDLLGSGSLARLMLGGLA